MKTLYTALLFCTLAFSPLLAQEKFTSEDLEILSSTLKDIESNGYTFEHKIEVQTSNNPHELALEVNTIDKKGRSNLERFEFNLIDLDYRLLRREVKSKTMFLTAKTEDGQKMIKYFEDGEQENYRNYFMIAVNGVDDYRALEELLEAAVKGAKKESKQLLSDRSLKDPIEFFQENVTTVKINDGAYIQELNITDQPYVLQLDADDQTQKSGKTTSAKFNLADLLEKSIKINVSGKKLYVKAGTQNGKRWIEQSEEGVFKSYGSALEIMVNNTTEARNIANILKELIPEAKKKEKERLEALASTDAERVSLIKSYIKDISSDKKDIKQEYDGDDIVSYTLTTLESNDKSIINEYTFNLVDFEKKKTTIKTSSSAVSVYIQGTPKLVKYLKNGNLQSYRNNVTLYCEQIEDAKALAYLLEKQIESCQEKQKEATVANGSAASLLADCSKFIADIDVSSYTYKQSLEAVDDVPCKLQFTQVKSDKDKDKEVLYEFNLSDMNAKSIDFAVSGKELSVQLFAKNKEKVIKRYLGDEKSDYVNNVKIFMGDVEETRNLIGLFKALVEACAE